MYTNCTNFYYLSIIVLSNLHSSRSAVHDCPVLSRHETVDQKSFGQLIICRVISYVTKFSLLAEDRRVKVFCEAQWSQAGPFTLGTPSVHNWVAISHCMTGCSTENVRDELN